jgi:hypothetical protein|nr:MAG TPA: tail fiber protein [Caudoviricetes sp.]
MAVQNIPRKVGPTTGNGILKEFPFSFKTVRASDVVVKTSAGTGVTDEEVTLRYGSDYTVTMNSNQDERPGGSVVLVNAPAKGVRVVVTSDTAIDQQLVLTNHDGFLPESLNDAYDKLTIICQELKEILGRCLIVPVTSEKTPQEVMSDLLDVAKKAAEYAQRAEVIYNSVAATERYVSTTWQEIQEAKATIDVHAAAIQAAVERAEVVLARVELIGKEVDVLAPHVDDLQTNAFHIDEIHRVGSDLRGFETDTLDLGSITDTNIDGETRVTEGYIKKVADHIDDCIHPVGNNIEKVESLHSNMEDIRTVASDLQGLSSPTLDLGLITDEPEDIPTIEGGYLKTLASISDDIAALGPKADDITTLKDNLPTLETTNRNLTVISSVAESITDVNAVSENLPKIDTVSQALGDIEPVSDSISYVTAVSENLEKIKAVQEKLSAVDAVSDNLAIVESAAGVAEELDSIRQDVLEANATAGFSFRYLATAEGSQTVEISSITPAVNTKVGDHVVNSIGEFFSVVGADHTSGTATLSPRLGSFKGEKGDKGDGLQVAGTYPDYESLSKVEGEEGKVYLAGLDLYVWTTEEVTDEDGVTTTIGSWVNAGELVGPKGETGATGAQGLKGEKGDKGDTGATPIIDIESTTLPAGSVATVTKSGTDEAPLFTFGIPTGATGATGEKGETGATGATGATPVITISVEMLDASASPSVVKSGTAEAPSFVLKIPRGQTGATGAAGQIPELVDLGGLS